MPRLFISSSSNLGLPPPHLSSSYLQFRRITVLPASSNSVANASSSAASVVVTRERGKNTQAHQCSEDNAFGWIIITSPKAGLVFLDAWKPAGSSNVKIGIVGGGTGSIFEKIEQPSKQYLNVAFAPSKATGKVLVSGLPKHGNERCTVLCPASAKASSETQEGLSKRGFKVYVDQVDQMALRQALSAPVVAVASPSAQWAWVNAVACIGETTASGNAVACIGKTTASAAKELGLRNVYYPADPGLDGWVDSIVESLKGHKQVQKV